MSDENKKKVALGTMLALLLGAGSYWFLGSGGGGDSDGLISGGTGRKVARVRLSDEPMTHKGKRRPKIAKIGIKNGKTRRGPRAADSHGRKTKRQPKNRDVIKKPKTRQPAA